MAASASACAATGAAVVAGDAGFGSFHGFIALVNERRHEEDMLKMLTTLSAPDSSATRGRGNRKR